MQVAWPMNIHLLPATPFSTKRVTSRWSFQANAFSILRRNEIRQNGHRMDEPNGTRIVHLYEEQGEKAFENLNGLFSGLLIDKRQGKAFLFNDRYALERIYYSEQADGFYFASEAKALLRVLPDSRSFDEDGVAQYLAFGCTLEERTLISRYWYVAGGVSLVISEREMSETQIFLGKKLGVASGLVTRFL